MSDDDKTEAREPKRAEAMTPEAAMVAEALAAAAAAQQGGADEAEAEAGDAPDAAAPEGELEALRAERDDLKTRLAYALAEAENIRKRAERDRRDAEAYGGSRLARDLLSVHDALEKALENVDDAQRAAAGSLVEGVELTQRELLSAFQKHKIEPVRPEKGERFDPNRHQAMFEAPVPGAETGAVIEVMQSGFTIAGRLLRAAMVGVARNG